ncbi:uncharacterized protein LOC117338471 [Pecten maximus]|uniref:uncharacterized protein LOC117338471 n=1 Tax=Pecten maximus TaxID=6579 RepID=UPI001458B814|nr:uncharacterized protein LOC117338471 [Pecten maximus]
MEEIRASTYLTIVCLAFVTWGCVVGIQFCPKELPTKCFCNKALTSVNCEGLHLYDIPAGIPNSTEKLYLTHNLIDVLNSQLFGFLPNLKELYLQNNKIIKLQKYAFHGQYTPNINLLRLDNNAITSLDRWSFYNLTTLETLYLGNNYINVIDENAFVGCTSVAFVVLDSNKLTKVPPLGALRGLQSLYIQANVINNSTIPVQYRNLTQLKNIGLSNNFITTLENKTFEALDTTSVIKLELSRNNINNISRHAFAPLNKIQSLKLGRNPITASVLESALVGLQGKPLRSLNIANLTLEGFIPNATFQLLRNTTINTLIMSNNKIRHIPSRAFADLENLQLIDLSSSGITSVADTAFAGLKTLTNLKLNDNFLDNVPKNLPSTLAILYLNGNRISSLPDDIFRDLTSLQTLYLGANIIVTLYQSSFSGLINLKILHLVQNKIGTLPGRVFQPLTRLVSLELNENNIKSIPDQSSLFESLNALQYLNLADNALVTMLNSLFNQLPSLQHFHLENNNIGNVMDIDREGKLFAGLHNLQTLDLSNNQIQTIHDSSFRDLIKLQQLNLRQNRVSGWGPHLFNKITKLYNLDLSHNMIALVNKTSVQDLGNLLSLNLTDNPFACTCDLRWFRDWINTTDIDIPGLHSYICNSPVSWRGKKLLSFDRTKINCLFFTLPVLLAMVGVAVVVVIFIIICLYRKRWFIRLRCHHMCRRVRRKLKGPANYEPIPGRDHTYDAYLSCAETDWRWVLENFLEGIDNGKLNDEKQCGGDFKLYFDQRDAAPGKLNMGDVVENMTASRKVIIILSNNYISDLRYEYELDYIIMLKAESHIEDYIVVASEYLKVKRVPKILHPIMRSERYLQWDDGDDAVQTIKGKVKDFLEKRDYIGVLIYRKDSKVVVEKIVSPQIPLSATRRQRSASVQIMEMRASTYLIIVCLAFVKWGCVVGIQFNKYCPKELPTKCFCNKALTSVNCEGLHLYDIPAGIPNSTEKLYLTHNLIDVLNSQHFGFLPNLKELYLQNNKIIKLQQYAFHGQYTPNINLVRLDNNVITSLDRWSFYNLTSLETLYLGNNYINVIDENAFVGCNSVAFVVLDSNKLTKVPPLGALRGLQSLYIQANVINNATIPVQYRNLTQLKNIGLSNNFITTLENKTFEALDTTSVIKLELSRNNINNISRHAFAPLNNIQSLKLGRNPITASVLESALVGLQGKPLRSLNIANLTLGGFIPNATFQLLRNTTINTLIMSNNKIRHIPSRAFADLENLQLIDLSSSGITSVADTAFAGLKTLTNLKLNDNFLDNVPKNLPSTLAILYLNGNRISSLPDDIFRDLTSLQTLYLGANIIVTLYQSSFSGLINLKILHLVQNKIGTLPGKVFQPLTRLVSLELNKNNIKSIPNQSSLFDSLNALQYLNLADNALGKMPSTLFNQLPSLQHFHLENNNIGNVMDIDREGKLFAGLHNLQTLDLSNNQIQTIHDSSFRDLIKLQQLNICQNRVSGWGPHLFNKMTKLYILDLSHNMIALVNKTSVHDLGNLMALNLTDNPFACTCDLRWFRDWVNTTDIAIPGLHSYICNSPVSWRGKKLLSFDRTKINCLFFTLPVLLAMVGVAVVVVIFIIICLYRKRWFIRLRCHRMCRRVRRKVKDPANYEPIPGRDHTYDAYLSCAETDWKWVLENFLEGIDNGKLSDEKQFGGDFKLYFDQRDAAPGKSYIANVVDNMEASRKVIIILSNNYVSDPRYECELDYVVMLKAKGVIEDYIVVASEYLKVKRVPKILHPMMRSERYLQWDDGDDAVQTIKGKVKDFLEKRDYYP